jgi:tetratricopeptide (TPR) repeat protein
MTWNIDPPAEELHVLLEAGFLYRDARMWDYARDIFQGVRSLRPQSDVPEVGLGTVAFQQGKFDVARKHYLRALERNPDSAFAQAHLAELSLFERNKDRAREHAAEALRLDPDGPFGGLAREVVHLAEVVEFKG